jgi:hypothetical protein
MERLKLYPSYSKLPSSNLLVQLYALLVYFSYWKNAGAMEKDCINAFCFRRLRVPVFFLPSPYLSRCKKGKELGALPFRCWDSK